MIIVSYPVATGGAFVRGIIGMMIDRINPPNINPNGSIQFFYPTIKTLHDSNIKLLSDTYPKSKIVCIEVDQEDYDSQGKNFRKKCIPELWCEDWYNTYKSESYPAYNPNVDEMPDYIIQDILNVNRTYIENWTYTFPEDMTNILVLNFKDIMFGTSLVDKLQVFFGINTVDESVYKFIIEYRTLQ